MTVTRFTDHILGPDTHANRPAASACPWGTVYKCTTHNMIERNSSGTWTDWASLDGLGSSTLTTKGDLLTRDASAVARLGVGSDGQVLTADSAQTLGVKWATPTSGSGSALAYKDYSAGTSVTNSTTTLTDIDATNLAVSFTAPASGRVLVRLTGVVGGTGVQGLYWGLRESTTDLAVYFVRTSTANDIASIAIPITGLTASSSHTYKWAQKVGGASASVTTFLGTSSTLAVMEVWALP